MADTPDPNQLKQAASMLDKMGMSAADITKAFKEMGPALVASMAGANAEYEQLEKYAQTIKKNLDQAKKQGQMTKANLRLKELENQQEQAILEAKIKAATDPAIKATLQFELDKLEAIQGQIKAQGKAAGLAQSYAKTLTGVSADWRSGLFGAFLDGGIEGSMQAVTSALAEQFSIANMLGSSLMKVQEATAAMVISADKQFASVNKLTNGTGEYNDMIMTTMQHNAEWNVSMEDAGEAVSELYTGMSQFTEMTEEAQGQLVEATAQLKGLGIDSATTAANFEILNKSLGMSAEQAIAVQKDFAAMAADLGVSAGKISKDFAANSDVFTAYGDEATTVFKEVAAAAKATGIEMQALLGITTQFDTFEGAAQSAGKLNAILGGGVLDSMELLNASEEERVRLLIQSIQLSGKSWSSMNKFERIAVANAAGVSDMTEANKLFGQSLSEYDKAQSKVEDNAEAQKKLEERAAAAANMQDKLTRIMEQFAVAVAPIVGAIHFLLDGFLQLNDLMGGFLVPVLITLLGVMAAIHYRSQMMAIFESGKLALTFMRTLLTSGLAAATGTLAIATDEAGDESLEAAPKMTALAVGLVEVSIAAAPLIPAIVALGFAIGGLALAIAAPFLAIAVLVWSLKELVIAFMEMPEAIAPALLGLIAFGAASMVALPMLAMGIAMFVAILAPVAPMMAPVAMGLLQLSGAALVFGIAAWFLGQGFKALKEGIDDFPIMMMIGLGLALIPFGYALMYAAIPFIFGAGLVGIGALLLGFGLQALAKGIEGFTKRGMFEAMLGLTFMLVLFGYGLMYAAIPFFLGAMLIGIPALLLGFGLQMLAKGIEGFTKRGMFEAMFKLTFMLYVFGIGLMYAAVPFLWGGTLVGVAALILGAGLLVLAKGINAFKKIGFENMLELGASLIAFGWLLIPAGIALLIGGYFLMWGAIPATAGLLLLWMGVKPWMSMDFAKLATLGKTLDAMTDGFLSTGFWLMFSGPMLMIGGMTAGIGLLWLAMGVAPWMAMDFEALSGLGVALAAFAFGIYIAGGLLMLAGMPFFIGALLVAPAMMILALPLMLFGRAIGVMAPFVDRMKPMAEGLIALGRALPTLGWGLWKLGIYAMVPWFDTGIRHLTKALHAFGAAMGTLSTEKAVALGQIFQGLAVLTDMDSVGDILWDMAWGIWAIGRALDSIPETKALSFNVTADSLANLIDSSVQLTPEVVENVEGMAKAAREYASAQKAMKDPSKDAFVEALRQVMGEQRSSGGSKEKKGQDIVLELDGDEFARAVNAAIDSKHGLKGF
jgi:hypothetical protein